MRKCKRPFVLTLTNGAAGSCTNSHCQINHHYNIPKKEDPRDSTLQSGNINTNPKDKKVVYGYTYTETLGNILPTTSIAFHYVHF